MIFIILISFPFLICILDAKVRIKRKMTGGNGSKQFSEGWIEYSDKKIAKKVASSLNNTPIGGKKSNFYHDDLWNLKYLKNFKWEYLTEKITYERKVRDAKLKASLIQAKKDNQEMAKLIEKTKVQDIISDRKRKHSSNEEENNSEKNSNTNMLKKKFRQQKAIGKDYDDSGNKVNKEVLNKIFAKK